MAQTYLLDLNGEPQNFTVPSGKKVYLVRAEQVLEGTATVTDLITKMTYVIPDGQGVLKTSIQAGTTVSLMFTASTNPDIKFVNAEVTSPR